MAQWWQHAMGAVHTVGKVVLSAFGAGVLGEKLEQLEADAGILPEWAGGKPEAVATAPDGSSLPVTAPDGSYVPPLPPGSARGTASAPFVPQPIPPSEQKKLREAEARKVAKRAESERRLADVERRLAAAKLRQSQVLGQTPPDEDATSEATRDTGDVLDLFFKQVETDALSDDGRQERLWKSRAAWAEAFETAEPPQDGDANFEWEKSLDRLRRRTHDR